MLEKIIEKYDVKTLVPYFRKIKVLLDEERISIAILGGFKAGKSSFLNTIIGQDILPVGVLPTTNIITKITYDCRFRISVVTKDNTFEISQEIIPEYLTEKRNPNNRKRIKEVNLFIPGIREIEGIELIDTPGIGSFFSKNTETTLNWTPESTFIIYAINPQQPFSAQDVQNMKEILTYTDKISLLLTKVDLLSPAERIEMAGYINQIAKQEFNRSFPIYFFSTKENTAAYLTVVKQELFLPLLLKKQENLNDLVAYKTTKLKESLRQYLQLLLETRRQEQSTIERLRNELISEQEFLRQIHRELGFIAKAIHGTYP